MNSEAAMRTSDGCGASVMLMINQKWRRGMIADDGDERRDR
jgi:hypothetical protein